MVFKDLSTPTAVALGIGLTGSAWISGSSMSLSHMTIPGLLSPERGTLPAPTLLTQWTTIYFLGRASMPFVSLATLISYAYASACLCKTPHWPGFLAAGALTFGIVPYTVIMMGATNAELCNAGIAVIGGDEMNMTEPEARVLVEKWRMLNFGRGLLPLAGVVVGMGSLFCM